VEDRADTGTGRSHGTAGWRRKLSGAAVGHVIYPSAWPVAAPLALAGLATLTLWAASRGVRAREGGYGHH
jgi:hypothetical protein